jgi:hypothetical protein
MWDEYQSMAFPDDYAGKDINDICVTSLDTFAAGCISAYVGDGRLDKKRIEVLRSCLDDLDTIIPALDERPKVYFSALKEICVEIVKDTKLPKNKKVLT